MNLVGRRLCCFYYNSALQTRQARTKVLCAAQLTRTGFLDDEIQFLKLQKDFFVFPTLFLSPQDFLDFDKFMLTV